MLPGPGITQLHKERSIILSEIELTAPLEVICISKIEYGPRIDFVREEELGKKMLVLRVYIKDIEFCVIIVIDVLKNGTEERTNVELVYCCELTDVGRVKATSIDVKPFKGVIQG